MCHLCGHFRSSNGWSAWLWMDTSLLLGYQRNRGQARQAPPRVQHKNCCWWPEQSGPAKEGPLPRLRHSHLSLSLPDCIVKRGLKGGRQKHCLVQAVLSSMEGCSEWVLLLFLLFFLWERVAEALGGGSVTDGLWVTAAFVDGGVCLNGRRAASLPVWPPEAGVGGGMGAAGRGTGGFDYGSMKGLRHNELVCKFTSMLSWGTVL